jgi:regulator of sirC expression with transglutaminase-like and TPR domain
MVEERLGHGGAAVADFQRYLQLAPSASDADQIKDRISRLKGGP